MRRAVMLRVIVVIRAVGMGALRALCAQARSPVIARLTVVLVLPVGTGP